MLSLWLMISVVIKAAMASSDEELLKQDVVGEPISLEEIEESKNLVENISVNYLKTMRATAGNDEIDTNQPKGGDYNMSPRWHDRKWPNAVIPYVLSAFFTWEERKVIANAIGFYNATTCIRMIPRTTERDFVHIVRGGRGCSSSVGRIGHEQILTLPAHCVHIPVVLHEIMHAAGFHHEQCRPIRDEYVRIHRQNIDPEKYRANFGKYSESLEDDIFAPYDYCSIMHYSPTDFSANGRPTFTVLKPKNCRVGEATTLSDIDIRKINTMYQCRGYPQLGCFDRLRRCHRSACYIPKLLEISRHNCAKTCGFC